MRPSFCRKTGRHSVISSSNKAEHGENTADILLSLKNVVVHPSGAGVSPGSSQSSSPSQLPHQPPPYPGPDLSQAQHVGGGGWGEEGQAQQYSNMPYNTPLYSVDGFGWTNPPFSPRPVTSSLGSPSHHFPTMSVNVSMNMTMHGVGYDPVADQWQHGYDQVRRMFYQKSNSNSSHSQIIFLSPPY